MIKVYFIRQNEMQDVFKVCHNFPDIEDYFEYLPKGLYTAKELEELLNE